MIRNQMLAGALGTREGDSLTLSSAWAKVTVTRRAPIGKLQQYTVSGDVVIDGRGTFIVHVDDIAQAFKIALESLAAYANGRVG